MGLLASVVAWMAENIARIGIFADRMGTDLLRERITTASWEKVADAPWFGLGLSEATVDLERSTWFFHNSYASLLVEGGWPLAVVVVLTYVFLGLRPFNPDQRSDSRVAVEAATLVLLICATQLGEVFFSLPGVLVLGAGLLLASDEIRDRSRRSKALERALVERREELAVIDSPALPRRGSTPLRDRRGR